MAESIVEKAIREAEEACQLAVASTPEAYRGFITFISQNKRVGGDRQRPLFATIRLPYMRVAGLIKMARDEHRAAGFMLNIDASRFETIEGRMVCRAVVNSAMLGTATGDAEVKFGGTGVDATNPIENSQTSAVGRALTFLGYGLYGSSVASAEEVLAAMNSEEREKIEETTGTPASPGTDTHQEPATQKQLGYLYALMKSAGIVSGDKHKLIESAFGENVSKRTVTELIDSIKSTGDVPGNLKKAYVKMIVANEGMDRQKVAGHMDDAFGHHDPANLSNAQFQQLIAHLYGSGNEPDDIPFPDKQQSAPTVQEWVELAKDKCTRCRLDNSQFAKWALAMFGGGNETDYTRLPREAFNSIHGMDDESLQLGVRSFDSEDTLQPTLI